jgi:2-polyprenyl-6-methoxyphenol hydroxylase-like FAD-dependent oxidoreductase
VVAQIGIAGGGIGGLTLAAALQAQGMDVVVFERQPAIRESGAGISLWPNALAALGAIGWGEPVRAVGRELASGGMRTTDGRSGATFSRRRFVASLGAPLVCIERGELVALLASALSPGTVRTGAEVVGYDVRPAGVRLHLADGSSNDVDALVGADGIHSATAAQMAGPLRLTYSGYTAWRGITEMVTEPDDDSFWACLESGHEFGWLPLRRDRMYWFATAWLPEAHVVPEGDRAYLAETFGRLPAPVAELLARTSEHDLIRNDIVDRAPLAQVCAGPVALIGDAAHPMRPHLGQGGCQAIEDAVALSRLLAVHDPVKAFGHYGDQRRRRTARIVELSRRASLTRPRTWRTDAFDRCSRLLVGRSIGPALRLLAPIASDAAGRRAVGLNQESSGKPIGLGNG